MSDGAAPPHDPGSLLRRKSYRVLLVLAAAIGVVVSVAGWGFLELIHYTQQWVFKELPNDLGFAKVPVWWPVPVLPVAGVIIASRSFACRALGPSAGRGCQGRGAD